MKIFSIKSSNEVTRFAKNYQFIYIFEILNSFNYLETSNHHKCFNLHILTVHEHKNLPMKQKDIIASNNVRKNIIQPYVTVQWSFVREGVWDKIISVNKRCKSSSESWCHQNVGEPCKLRCQHESGQRWAVWYVEKERTQAENCPLVLF